MAAPRQPAHSVPARRWLWWVKRIALAAVVALCAWEGWRAYDQGTAIREAQTAGWKLFGLDPIMAILVDWRAAGRKETWTVHCLRVEIPSGTDLAAARPLLARLRPAILIAARCPNPNLDALYSLPTLTDLTLSSCTGLQNIDGLLDLPSLREITLEECNGLQSLGDLRRLPSLQGINLRGCTGLKNVDNLRAPHTFSWLSFNGCTELQNLDGLRGLPTLQLIILPNCTGLRNVDGIRGLPGVHLLYLDGCTSLSASALRELRAALPKADITFPDGTHNPPPK